MAKGANSTDAPVVGGRLLVTVVLAAAFLAATARGIGSQDLLVSLYMAATMVLFVGFNWVEGARLRSFLKSHFPEEYRKLVPRENELGYNSLREWRFAFSSEPDDAPALAHARSRARRVWSLSILMIVAMIVVIQIGDSLSARM